MDQFQEQHAVTEQYRNDTNLNIRISLHEKYSTNKLGFNNWVISQYSLKPEYTVLELGCGNAESWVKNSTAIAGFKKLILSDISEGMVESAKKRLAHLHSIDYKVIDIENIPYGNNNFDAVIANMMLYHVPDLDKGLSEVKRVVKDTGTFYCATVGQHGIIDYLDSLITHKDPASRGNTGFSLQNGMDILQKFFSEVTRRDYIDSLAVTDVDDIVNYVYSLSSIMDIQPDRGELKKIFETNMVHGVLTIPKECGMFVCKK